MTREDRAVRRKIEAAERRDKARYRRTHRRWYQRLKFWKR